MIGRFACICSVASRDHIGSLSIGLEAMAGGWIVDWRAKHPRVVEEARGNRQSSIIGQPSSASLTVLSQNDSSEKK
jgi:hypothetical protein